MCLMGLIFIAIVVLIIMSALGLDKGKFNAPDTAKPSSSSSTTTTTTSGSTPSGTTTSGTLLFF